MVGRKENLPLRIFTIGHSNKTLDDFIGLLQAHSVKYLVDVRTIPRSRHNPQFNNETLPDKLNEVGILYKHLKSLGGLRHSSADSPNRGWRNTSFRGFADYMQTPEFDIALNTFIELAETKQVAIMCAEAVPWRCHRSLIADALLIRNITVEHIMTKSRLNPHFLTPFAKIDGTVITYPTDNPNQEELDITPKLIK